jgi:NADPH:quinone reductase
MVAVVQVRSPGGPERLELADVQMPAPGPDEVAIRQTAIGVNFVDTYFRSGLYPLSALPAVLGFEGAGVVAAVGRNVTTLMVGDRIAYAGPPMGAYAAERILPAWRCLALPATIPEEVAAAGLVKALTVQMLTTVTYPVNAGTKILVHAAAGGVGSLLVKWAKRRGAMVIGTVSSAAKAETARANGCDHVVIGRDANFVRAVADFTDGAGVDVAYDGVGGTTLRNTLRCVRLFGMVASIGQAAGPIPPLAVEELGTRTEDGKPLSLSLSRPSVLAYINQLDRYRSAAADVMSAFDSGILPTIGRSFPLSAAAAAHADLEAGHTTGSILLLPDRV